VSRILLFACDPGGANTIIPLIEPLRMSGHELLLFGKDVALDRYRQAGLDCNDIMAMVKNVGSDAILQFVDKVAPDVLVTGTSANDFTEKLLWNACSELNIPSLAIVDQWCNYGLRFSGYGVSRIESYRKNETFAYLPTRIAAMDEHARTEMIAEGLPGERIVVCGQPHFETLLAKRGDSAEIARCCAANSIAPGDSVVVFASEPLTTTYGENVCRYWGYSEISILEALVSSLEIVAGESEQPVVLIVRPHPKENSERFFSIINSCRRFRCLLDTVSASRSLMTRADLVCGMSSMFLIESVILKRSVMSIQIGLCREDPFILARRMLIRSILTEKDLTDQLRRGILQRDLLLPEFEVIGNPVERVVIEIESLICQNSL